MSTKKALRMGSVPEVWKGSIAKTITFSITEDCNLACKYCYMTGKNSKNKMSFETAKKVVDYILGNREKFNEKAIVWEFVGGEPFLEIDLIDKICDYIKLQMYKLEHPWFDSYRFSFSSNGLLYNTPKVQNYIKKNKTHLSIGISIDGNKIKHDMQRVKPDGSGSYDDLMKNIPLWLEQFPGGATKATFSHDDIIYLKDSIINLWEIGIKDVAANIVYEDVWLEGDDSILENQLRELGDYILEKELWREYSVSFFEPSMGFPLSNDHLNNNFCGAGKMLAIDYKGRFFPCIRFLDFALDNQKGLYIGDTDNGLNNDMLRPFKTLNLKTQSSYECLSCEVATGCAWCTGYNFDSADTDTIYQRSTSNCKMHKANVRACKYFWDKYENITGIDSPRRIYEKDEINNKFFNIMTSDNIIPHCTYKNWKNTNNSMSEDMIKKGIEFCEENDYVPVIMGYRGDGYKENFNIVDAKSKEITENSIIVCDNHCEVQLKYQNICILLISKYNIHKLSEFIEKIYPNSLRINVILEDIEQWVDSDLDRYEQELDKLKSTIIDTYINENPLELNILTDRIFIKKMCNCDAGNETFTLAPNGKIYICPAFYYDNPENSIGDIVNGLNIKNSYLLELNNAPICSECDAYQCKRCKFLNKKLTGEMNTPSRIQCLISHMERNKSRELQLELDKHKFVLVKKLIEEIDYLDPLEKILEKRRVQNV